VIRERVIKARRMQEERFSKYNGIHCNAQMSERMIHQYAEPDEAGISMLREIKSFRPCLQPNIESRAHHRRPRVERKGADGTSCRSHFLSQSRPWRLGGARNVMI
jgi:magnesium chelatase family protein